MTRGTTSKAIFAAVAAGCWLAASAFAGAAVIAEQIEAHSVLELEAWPRIGGTPEELRLAEGAVLALRHKDETALAILTNLSRTAADNIVRAAACRAMADVLLRQTRYAEAHAAFQCVQDVSGKPLSGEPRQALGYTGILSGEKPMLLAKPVSGVLDVFRDNEGLIRAPVEINGTARQAVLDTDASFCALGETQARRLNLRMLAGDATIVTSTRADLPMHLGVADTLKFGEAEFSNVVFAVLPDEAVRFGRGYKMDVLIGLPVFVALERIALAREGGWEKFHYGPRPASAGPPNLILSGFDPFVQVDAGNGAILRLAFDTAASNTLLNATVLKNYPWLGEWALRSQLRVEGGGGAKVDSNARAFRNWKFDVVGDGSFTLKQVKILSADEGDRHGMLGQDALKGRDWVLDFAAMRFTLGD